jgi:hypothetical protein
MKNRFVTLPAFSAILAMSPATPAPAQGCFVSVGRSETVSVDIGAGQSAEMTIHVYEDRAGLESVDEIPCEAWITVPLSAFPTVRLATRPLDVAPVIRHLARESKVRECRVHVWRHDDLDADLPDDEECIAGDFRFENGDWWASGSERSCDEIDG